MKALNVLYTVSIIQKLECMRAHNSRYNAPAELLINVIQKELEEDAILDCTKTKTKQI